MAQKKKKSPKPVVTPTENVQTAPSPAVFSWKTPAFVLFFIGVLLYANTFSHEYALDDAIVVESNKFTEQGFAGIPDLMTHDAFVGYFGKQKYLVAGGRYRPLSMVTLAIEVGIFGKDNPEISHVINAIMYGAACLLLYLVLLQFFPSGKQSKWWATVPFLAALLFTVHPLHTEVVANIKGRDEIMALLLSLVTVWLSIRYIDTKKVLNLALSLVVFMLALLSKESAIPFVAVVPMAIYFFRKVSLKESLIATAPLVAAFGVYLLMRQTFAPGVSAADIPKEILNDPFLNASAGERLGTVFYTLGRYISLQLFPHPLTHDYYFNQIPLVNILSLKAIIPLLAYLCMGIYAVIKLPSRHPISFAILFYLGTLSIVSNLFFSIGVTMGERFVFIPSIGFMLMTVLAFKGLGKWLSEKSSLTPETAFLSLGMIFAVGFSIKTVARNPVWKNNETLFLTDIHTSPESAKLNKAAGGFLVDKSEKLSGPKRTQALNDAVKYLNKAIEIYPTHGENWLLRGNANYRLGQYPQAEEAYKNTIAYSPNSVTAYKNLAVTLAQLNKFEQAAQYRKTIAKKFEPNDPEATYLIGLAYDDGGKGDSALKYFQNAVRMDPNYADAYAKLGKVYGQYYNNLDLAIANLRKAIDLGHNDAGTYENLGISYAIKQDFENALAAFSAGQKKFPNSANLYYNLAVTYGNLGRQDLAQQNMAKAIQLNPQKFGGQTPPQ